MKIEQITPQLIIDAYIKTKLIPAKGSNWDTKDYCGCALVALAKANNLYGVHYADIIVDDWTDKNQIKDWTDFWRGFDENFEFKSPGIKDSLATFKAKEAREVLNKFFDIEVGWDPSIYKDKVLAKYKELESNAK